MAKKSRHKKFKREIKRKKRKVQRIGERWITKIKEVKLTKKERIFEERAKAITDRGRERGFIMEAEILKFFPDVEKNIAELERLYDRLEEANIKVEESQDFIKDAVPEPTDDEINRFAALQGWQ